MDKKVKLDPSKVQYDGNSFTVVLTEEELKKKFTELKKKISEDHGEVSPSQEDEAARGPDQSAQPL
jgi:hypothetical protein